MKWRNLIEAWVEFEEVSNYESLKLGSKGRPQAVTDWIRRVRRPEYRPEINDLPAYEKDFRAWWTSLQPPWRSGNGCRWPPKREKKGDWAILCRSGQNGLLSVVAALFFWGFAARNDDIAMAAWSIAADDVLYVLTEMV